MDKDVDHPLDIEIKEEFEPEDDCKMPVNELLVQFFYDNPYFFDVSHEDFKNTKKREVEVAQFASSIGWSPEAVMKRWKNLRTDYGKLRKGQGAKKMSSLQLWKLKTLAFLDEHIMRRGSGQETGRGATEEDGYDVSSNDGIDQVVSTLMQSSSVESQQKRMRSPGTSNGVQVKKRKLEKKRQREVSEVVADILEYNRKKDEEVQKKAESQLAKQPTERGAYAAWLTSVVMQVPNEQFRRFQSETFGLCMRYLPDLKDGPSTSDAATPWGQ